MASWGDNDWGQPDAAPVSASDENMVPVTSVAEHIEPVKMVPTKGWHAGRKRFDADSERDEAAENELFNTERVNVGINFAEMATIPVKVAGEDPPDGISTFRDAKLHPLLEHNVIDLMKYEEPTPIQSISIPILGDGRDLMACAQTGSGKTAAYLIPIMNKLLKRGKEKYYSEAELANNDIARPLVLIIVPTRELACQVFDECLKFAYKTWVRPTVIYGGSDTQVLKAELRAGAHILVATTGKLKDFLNRGLVSLSKTKFLVIDEADRLLDEGFESDIFEIVQGSDMPQDESRQTALFSATFAKGVRRLAREFLNDCLLVTVGRVGKVPKDIFQKLEWVDSTEKRSRLLDILYDQAPGQVIIFVNGIRAVDSLDDFLFQRKFPVTSIHSKRSQAEREDAIASFRSGNTLILIATDVAARGLDIPNIVHVINYDLPPTIEEYIHRIGRTARVGNKGLATSFYNDRDVALGPDIAKVLIEAEQEIPDFLESYAEEFKANLENGDEAVVENELREEDFEGELPAHHIPLNQRQGRVEEQARALQTQAANGGSEWGASAAAPAAAGGDDWGTSAAPAATGGDDWGTPANNDNADSGW